MRKIKAKVASILATAASLMMFAAPVAAATVVVIPGDLGTPPDPFTEVSTWYFGNDNTGGLPTATESVNHEFVDGPGTPPAGDGSLRFETTSAGDRWTFATNKHAGDDLDSFTALGFSMYVPASSASGSTYTLFLNADIDFDSTTSGGYQGRLVYVPQDNGAVPTDSWQDYDADAGLWRWSRFEVGVDNNIATIADNNKWPDGNTNALRSLADIKTAFPNAAIWNEGGFTGQILIRAGHPGPLGLVNYLDKVVINDSTYDLERVLPEPEMPVTKDDCKKGGWQAYSIFKNQGDCVSWVATGGRNLASF